MRPALLLLLPAALCAQPPVAPTREPVGPSRGDNAGAYNILNSFETGYRFHSVAGNTGKYRSDVNYRNGLRLLSSRLSIHSRDGHGGPLDELQLTTQGLGNDPYQSANLRAEKNRLWRYDLLWRSNAYYNPALPVALGQHLLDTTRRLQDHDLTLLPQSKIRFFAGFSRNTQTGPALSTIQVFDSGGDEFPLFSDIRRRQNEYRFGAEAQVFGFKLHALRSWEQYDEETVERSDLRNIGNNPADRTALDRLARTAPWSGSTPSWRVNLFREQGRYWAFNGRFTNSAGRRNFVFDEGAVGMDRFGEARNRQVVLAGNARRPVTTGQLTISLFPHDSVTLTNHTAFHHTRMEGDARYREIENSTLQDAFLSLQFLGLRSFTNSTNLNWRARPWLAVRGGYVTSERRVRSVEGVAGDGFKDSLFAEQNNRLNAASLGFRLKPVKPFTFSLDGELGRNDRPFFPTSDRNHHGLSARAQWRGRSLQLSALARGNYSFNSVSLFSHSARTRHYSFDASWTPYSWFAVETGYSRLHADTVTGLAYFVSLRLTRGDSSIYRSNLHAAHVTLRWAIRDRVDLYAGYHRTQDTGDGRVALAAAPAGLPSGSAQPGFLAAQTFPLTFDSPLLRLSVRLTSRARWNLGYQHYRYDEVFLPAQNYRAHTGYASVLWSF